MSGRKLRPRRRLVPASEHSRFSDYKKHRDQEKSANPSAGTPRRSSSSASQQHSTPASVASSNSTNVPDGDDESFVPDDEASEASSSAVESSREENCKLCDKEDEDRASEASASSTMSRGALQLMAKRAVHVSSRVPLSVLCGDNDDRVRRKLKSFADGAPKEGYQYRAFMEPVMTAAVRFYKESGLGLREVAAQFRTNKDALRRSVQQIEALAPGRQFITSPKEERITAKLLMVFGSWGFAFDFKKLADLLERYLELRFVKSKAEYDELPDDAKCDVREPHRPFRTKNGWISRPGPRWVANFIFRHPDLTKRLAANRRLCHGKLGPELINR